jgi:FkbM family methyltransferase
MKEFVKKVFRSVQVYFPFLQDFRFSTQRKLNRMLGKPHEGDFSLLKQFPDNGQMLFVDIGTNRGDAIQSMLTMTRNCTVVGFEPNPIVYAKTASLYKNTKQVTIHNCGLGKEKGAFTLYLPFFRKFMFDGLASFDRNEAQDWLKGRIFGYNSKLMHIKELNCEVKRLDDFNLSPWFIKIDVQGFEYEVLEGGLQTLKRSQPALLIETPSEEVMGLLSGLGYKPYYFDQNKLVPGRGALNTYFFNDEKKAMLKTA